MLRRHPGARARHEGVAETASSIYTSTPRAVSGHCRPLWDRRLSAVSAAARRGRGSPHGHGHGHEIYESCHTFSLDKTYDHA